MITSCQIIDEDWDAVDNVDDENDYDKLQQIAYFFSFNLEHTYPFDASTPFESEWRIYASAI